MNFWLASRSGDAGDVGLTVSLVGATTVGFTGTYLPSSTLWVQNTTNEVTIATAGYYNVRFSTVAASNIDRTTYLDSVSYSVIPEPSTALLGGLGVLALLRRRR